MTFKQVIQLFAAASQCTKFSNIGRKIVIKSLGMAILGLVLLAQPALAGQQKYFYVYGVADAGGDGPLTTSSLLGLSQCQSAEAAAQPGGMAVIQQCVPACNSTLSNTAWTFIQSADTDNDGSSRPQAIGIYLHQEDCAAGIAAAQGVGFTDISSVCVTMKSRLYCK